MNFLAIDPGVHTGWALWHGHREPVQVGQFNMKRVEHPTLEGNLKDLWGKFDILLAESAGAGDGIELCLIEGVKLFAKSAKSQMAGVKGDLAFLSYLVGGYCNILFQNGIPFNVILPDEWKGQMNDEVVEARIMRALKKEYRTAHIRSAVGLGLSHLGIL